MSSWKRTLVVIFVYLKKIKTEILFCFCEDFVLAEFVLRHLPLFRKTKLNLEVHLIYLHENY